MKINIKKDFSWQVYSIRALKLWLKGYIHNKSIEDLLHDLQILELKEIENYLLQLDGHFALVVQTDDWTIVAVDKTRSIPLFWAKNEVGSHASTLVKNSALTKLNQGAILALKMSGCTINEDTLYQGLNTLKAGQCIIFENDKKYQRLTYYQYQPWKIIKQEDYQQELAEVTLNILRKMIKSLNGRQVIIPLSAGNDSRLIASGLKHLGYENVKCYSYGMKGNFEAGVAKLIAKKLGYEFKFISLTLKEEKIFYQSKIFKKYLEFADSCTAVPNFQSLSTIPRLKNWIDKDAVFVNGQSGDFISGAHIKPSMQKDNKTLSIEDRSEIIFKETIEKHFSLWGNLKTKDNLANIKKQLLAEMPIKLNTASKDHGLYEYSEFINRQGKYVISGQRVYEFYGFEWRLPLWDDEYLKFWQKIPLEKKANQNLYVSMLKSENWAGVWGDEIPVNKKTIRPLWIIPLRFLAKIPFFFFGKKGKNVWRQFEINIFYYFMDITRMMSNIRYFRVVNDFLKAPKNHVSWQVCDYLKSKNIR